MVGFITWLCETIQDVAREIGPRHSGDYGWVLFLAFFAVAYVSRKEFGGFWKAVWSLFWFLIFLFLLECISPALMWCFLALGVVVLIAKSSLATIKMLVVVLVIAGVLCLVVKQNFLMF